MESNNRLIAQNRSFLSYVQNPKLLMNLSNHFHHLWCKRTATHCFCSSTFIIGKYWKLITVVRYWYKTHDWRKTYFISEFHSSSIQNHLSWFELFLNFCFEDRLDRQDQWKHSCWFVFWNGYSVKWQLTTLVSVCSILKLIFFYHVEILWFAFLFRVETFYLIWKLCDSEWIPGLGRTWLLWVAWWVRLVP